MAMQPKSAKQAKFLQDMAAPSAPPAASTGMEDEAMPELDPAAVDEMTTNPTASEPSMLDLSQASDEELQAELDKRKQAMTGGQRTRIPMAPPSKTQAIPPTEVLGSY